MQPLIRASGDGIRGILSDTHFLAEGSREKLEPVFRELSATYGQPVFGGQGQNLPPISARRIPPDIIKALKNLPRAEVVQNASDAPRAGLACVIRSARSRRPLAAKKGRGHEGATIVVDSSNESRVVWKLEKHGDAYQIVNARSGLVLDAAGSGPIAQRKPNRSLSQAWKFVKDDNAYQIQCQETGRVLDVSGGSAENGTEIIAYPQKQPPSSNQMWVLTEARK